MQIHVYIWICIIHFVKLSTLQSEFALVAHQAGIQDTVHLEELVDGGHLAVLQGDLEGELGAVPGHGAGFHGGAGF